MILPALPKQISKHAKGAPKADPSADPKNTGGTAHKDGVLVERFLKRAVAHQTAGRLAQAEDIYRQILEVDPDNPEANHLLGLLVHQNGNHTGAIELIEKAITLKPGFYEAYNNLGAILMIQNRPTDAEENFRQALALRPDYQEAQCNLDFLLKQREGGT